MLEVLDSRQIAEWIAYYSIEPFGEHAAYWRAGQIASTIANVNRPKGKRAFTVEDFMPHEPKTTPVVQTPEEMADVLRRTFEYAKRHSMTKQKGK